MSRALTLAGLATALFLPSAFASNSSVFEIAGSTYTANDSIFESSPIFSDNDQKVDLVGGDITFGSANGTAGGFLFTLGGAYGTFDSHVNSTLAPGGSVSEENHLAMAHLMIGYRYSHKISTHISLFAGAHIGLSTMGIAASDAVVTSPTTGQLTGIDDSYDYDFGFAYILEAGASFHVSDSFYLFASYQLTSSSATPEIKLNSGESVKVNSQSYQAIRFGLGFSF